MGKCISKHPSVLTIALSEKDLATANQIWSKFAESTEYIVLKDEHGNQLCEYYYVSGKKKKKSKNNNNNNNANKIQQYKQQQEKQEATKAAPEATTTATSNGDNAGDDGDDDGVKANSDSDGRLQDGANRRQCLLAKSYQNSNEIQMQKEKQKYDDDADDADADADTDEDDEYDDDNDDDDDVDEEDSEYESERGSVRKGQQKKSQKAIKKSSSTPPQQNNDNITNKFTAATTTKTTEETAKITETYAEKITATTTTTENHTLTNVIESNAATANTAAETVATNVAAAMRNNVAAYDYDCCSFVSTSDDADDEQFNCYNNKGNSENEKNNKINKSNKNINNNNTNSGNNNNNSVNNSSNIETDIINEIKNNNNNDKHKKADDVIDSDDDIFIANDNNNNISLPFENLNNNHSIPFENPNSNNNSIPFENLNHNNNNHLYATQSHNINFSTASIFVCVNDNTYNNTQIITATHKSQQHCLAAHLVLQSNTNEKPNEANEQQRRNDDNGDSELTLAAADTNNNAKNITEQQQQQQLMAVLEKAEQRHSKLAKDQTLTLINDEVCKVNIGVKYSSDEVDVVDGRRVGSKGRIAKNYLAVLSRRRSGGGDIRKGQAESKKHLKKYGVNNTTNTGTIGGTGGGVVGGVIETKGTAMSFGFRKKLNTTPKKFKKLLEAGVGGGDNKKKQDKCNNVTTITTQRNEDNEKLATVINSAENDGTSNEKQEKEQQKEQQHDKNGNAELLDRVHFEKMGTTAAAAATTTTTQRTNQSQPTPPANLPGVASRFGYRGTNIARPASAGAGLTMQRAGQMDGMQDNAENNNNSYGSNNGNNNNNVGGGVGGGQQRPLVSNLKRRSKSAHAGRALTSGCDDVDEAGGGASSDANGRPKISQPKSITFNLSQNSTIEIQRRQFFEQPPSSSIPNTYGSYGTGTGGGGVGGVLRTWPHQPTAVAAMPHTLHQSRNVINTGMHTNVILRPTPRAPPATFSKFTLHTVSLPKPEFPVAISLGASTPTTPGSNSIYTPSPTAAAATITMMTPTHASVTGGGGARAKQIQLQPQPQHPLTIVASAATVTDNFNSTITVSAPHMDLKTAKQMANNTTRHGFSGSREISADSGIASMDMALDSSASSVGGGGGRVGTAGGGRSRNAHASPPKRSRSRPRNLQMVMNGRHKFEVRDLDDPLSMTTTSMETSASESCSFVEPLALPKLPIENQAAPLSLCGLVRSNTVLSRESYDRNGGVQRSAPGTSHGVESKKINEDKPRPTTAPAQCNITRNSSEESEGGADEEKLYLDRSTSEKGNRFKDINTCSSKTSSPGSSIMLSWCNAGESLAVKDCSSLSFSSEDSNKTNENAHKDKDSDTEKNEKKASKKKDSLQLNDEDDLSALVTDMQISTLSSLTETLPHENNLSCMEMTAPRLVMRATHAAAAALAGKVDKSNEQDNDKRTDRPKSFYNTLNETKFAEMALAGSTFLLDDETSPTDSLVSSSGSEEAAAASSGANGKQRKHKANEELQDKNIDEISPELEALSPISPGTPTHASHSLSLSDCGNLIDDEIADQPALLFNSESHDLGGGDSLASRKDKTDTPTLMENTSIGTTSAGGLSGSICSLKSLTKSRTALQQAIELSLRTPLLLRKAVMERADSLDTLSPCESICSDDLMMDFDMNSSVDSIDRGSIKSRSGSDLHKISDTELFSELERKGSDVMKELNTILRQRTNKKEKDSVIAHLPARATRLLNRSRLQQQQQQQQSQYSPSNSNGSPSLNKGTAAGSGGGGGAVDSDSSVRSTHSTSLRRSAGSTRASNASIASASSTATTNGSTTGHQYFQHYQQQQHKPFQYHYSQLLRDSQQSSSDDLMLSDKSFRNAMIQDVLQFKRQLLRLRRILQETETTNPFDSDCKGSLYAACGLDRKLLDDLDLDSLASSSSVMDDPLAELADLRRQVVYLEGEVEDRERIIRLQKNQIERLESKKPPSNESTTTKECINTATQTERMRPFSYGAEGLSRSKPEYTSYTTHYHPADSCDNNNINNNTCTQQKHCHCNLSASQHHHQQQPQAVRRHTIISTTLSNYNHNQKSALAPRRASFAWEKPTATAPNTANSNSNNTLTQSQSQATLQQQHAPIANQIYKPVKITLIGEPLKQWQWNAFGNGNQIATNTTGTTTTKTYAITNGNNKAETIASSNGVAGGVGSDNKVAAGECESKQAKEAAGRCGGGGVAGGSALVAAYNGVNGISNYLTKGNSKVSTLSNGLMSNGSSKSSSSSKVSNGYTNGNGNLSGQTTKTNNDCNGNQKQNGCSSNSVALTTIVNGGSRLQLSVNDNRKMQDKALQKGPTEQQQPRLQTQQAQQQQHKPLQFHQAPTSSNSKSKSNNANANANLYPTVTIV